jgi:hypothetical protein
MNIHIWNSHQFAGQQKHRKIFPGGRSPARARLADRIEVDSLDLNLIETCAANGFGIGLSVAAPKTRISLRLSVLKLDDFVSVVVGAS